MADEELRAHPKDSLDGFLNSGLSTWQKITSDTSRGEAWRFFWTQAEDELVAHAKNALEGFSELWIENGVDDWVHAGVDIACQGGQLSSIYHHNISFWKKLIWSNRRK